LLLLSKSTTCPGLFYNLSAVDGMLARIRIPGGILSIDQCYAIANLASDAAGYVHVTNRANIQVREIQENLSLDILNILQELGLGSQNREVDPIRNIMSSPTAGIDPEELIDTRPFVKALDNYYQENTQLAQLSPKFSVCLDGGGMVSVGDRLNDILLLAVDNAFFRLCLVGINTGILVKPEQVLILIAALAEVYLSYTQKHLRKPRMKDLLQDWGIDLYLQQVEARLPFALTKNSSLYEKKGGCPIQQVIGIHPQRQVGLSYIGVVLPLGRLESWQLQGLAAIAQTYTSEIRLTPWQNLLIPNIPNRSIVDVRAEIHKLGLDSQTSLYSSLIACSGTTGCLSSNTDTQAHAKDLVQKLKHINLLSPINIHFSGCEKSCAQHGGSDITLVGTKIEKGNKTVEGYHVYLGNGDSTFGHQIYQNIEHTEVSELLEQIIKLYQTQSSANESFQQFASRYISFINSSSHD